MLQSLLYTSPLKFWYEMTDLFLIYSMHFFSRQSRCKLVGGKSRLGGVEAFYQFSLRTFIMFWICIRITKHHLTEELVLFAVNLATSWIFVHGHLIQWEVTVLPFGRELVYLTPKVYHFACRSLLLNFLCLTTICMCVTTPLSSVQNWILTDSAAVFTVI
jgi:hypothetical protein